VNLSTMARRRNTKSNRVQRKKVATKPVVVVTTVPRRPRRRNRKRQNRSGNGDWRPYHLYGLKCNDKGYLTFGPSGDTPSLGGGTLKACSEYKIRSLRVQWKAQASSTAAGSMAIQIGLGNTLTGVDNRSISFKLTNSGNRTFSAKDIGGDGRMLNTKDENQFRLAYAGNGDSSIAGDLLCFFLLETRMPK